MEPHPSVLDAEPDPTGSAASDAAGLAVYTPTAVAVSEAGRTSFDLNGAADGRVYWLVVGALGKRWSWLAIRICFCRSPKSA